MDWIATLLGILGYYHLSNNSTADRKWGWYLLILSTCFYLVVNLKYELWGAAAGSLFYLWLEIRGYRNE